MSSSNLQTGPLKLFFSDLQSGPKTGWEGSATRGAAVSIWGNGFGATRGSSYVTVNGAQLTSDSDYAEWGATQNNARGLERITFWVPSTASDGAGTITVTVNGTTSASVPFTVRAGNIYFIATNGSDSNNGKYSTSQGGSNGPWLKPYFADAQYGHVKAGDIIYVRGGTYLSSPTGWPGYINAYYGNLGSSGSPGLPVAMVGHPVDIAAGSWPKFGDTSTTPNGIICYWGNPANVRCHDLEWHKILWTAGYTSASLWGDRFRMVGNRFEDNTLYTQAEALGGVNVKDSNFYGNIFKNNGYNGTGAHYKHDMYWSASHPGNTDITDSTNLDIAWNEFSYWIGGTEGTPSFTAGGYNPQKVSNFRIHDNYWHDGGGGASFVNFEYENIYFYNNIIANNTAIPGSIDQGIVWGTAQDTGSAHTSYTFNNTFYATDGTGLNGTIIVFNNTVYAPTYVYNNIIYAKNATKYLTVSATSSSVGQDFILNNNCYYGLGALSSSTVYAFNPNDPNAVCGNTDPAFVSIANADFHLAKGSPAIDTGTSKVSTIVPGVAPDDYDGNPRPFNLLYDIGAYEYYQ